MLLICSLHLVAVLAVLVFGMYFGQWMNGMRHELFVRGTIVLVGLASSVLNLEIYLFICTLGFVIQTALRIHYLAVRGLIEELY